MFSEEWVSVEMLCILCIYFMLFWYLIQAFQLSERWLILLNFYLVFILNSLWRKKEWGLALSCCNNIFVLSIQTLLNLVLKFWLLQCSALVFMPDLRKLMWITSPKTIIMSSPSKSWDLNFWFCSLEIPRLRPCF